MWKVTSGIFLGWGLGGNDSADIFGTGVATGIVKYRTAILLTAIFVVIGALLEGPKCMKTVGELSRLLPIAAFGCSLAAAITMAALTYPAIPASTSQAIVGAVVGVGLVRDVRAVSVRMLAEIGIGWVSTPLSAGLLAYLIMRTIT